MRELDGDDVAEVDFSLSTRHRQLLDAFDLIRIRVLVVPVAQISKDKFSEYYDLVRQFSVVNCKDITPDLSAGPGMSLFVWLAGWRAGVHLVSVHRRVRARTRILQFIAHYTSFRLVLSCAMCACMHAGVHKANMFGNEMIYFDFVSSYAKDASSVWEDLQMHRQICGVSGARVLPAVCVEFVHFCVYTRVCM